MAMNQNNAYDVTVNLPYPRIQAETRRNAQTVLLVAGLQ